MMMLTFEASVTCRQRNHMLMLDLEVEPGDADADFSMRRLVEEASRAGAGGLNATVDTLVEIRLGFANPRCPQESTRS